MRTDVVHTVAKVGVQGCVGQSTIQSQFVPSSSTQVRYIYFFVSPPFNRGAITMRREVV